MSRVDTTKRSYWLCQAIGWGLYVVWTVPTAWGQGGPARIVIETLLSATMGIALTHGYRSWAQRAEAPRRVATQLLRIGGAAFLLAFVHVGVLVVLEVGIFRDQVPSFFIYVLSAYLRWTFLFAIWGGLYTTATLARETQARALRAVELTAALKTAELRELRAQLNPHFLFNTLNGIRSLIDEDKARARQAVSELASVLRFTLRVSQNETIELREELAMVDAYLALEALRLESRLVVERHVAEATLGMRVPCMLVFTLVENAIKHGIARLPEGGTVDLRIVSDDTLSIRVVNPRGGAGLGLEPKGEGGIGLANLKSRLALLYGENGVIAIDDASPERFVVSVRIQP